MTIYDAAYVKNLNIDQIKQLPASVFSAFTQDGVRALNAYQLGALDANQFFSLTQPGLNYLSASAVRGVTPEHLATLTEAAKLNSLFSIGAAQVDRTEIVSKVNSISTKSFSSLGSAQIGSLHADVIGALSAQHLNLFDLVDFNALSSGALMAISAKAISGIKTEVFSALSGGALSNMLSSSVTDARLNAAAVRSKVSALGVDDIEAMSPTQFSSVSPLAVSFLTKFQTAKLGADVINGLTSAQAKSFSAQGLSGFKPEDWAALTGSRVADLLSSSVTDARLNAMDIRTKVMALGEDDIAALMPAQVKLVSPVALSYLTMRQVAKLGADVVNGMTADQAKSISAQALAGLSPENWAGLSNVRVGELLASASTDPRVKLSEIKKKASALSADDVAALAGKTGSVDPMFFSALNNKQTEKISASFLNCLSADQMKAFSDQGLMGLSSKTLTGLNAGVLAGLMQSSQKDPALNASEVKKKAMAIDAADILAVVAEGLSSFAQVFKGLPKPFYAALTSEKVAAMGGVVTALGGDELASISAQGFSGIKKETFANMDTGVLRSFFGDLAIGKPQSDADIRAKVATLDADDIKAMSAINGFGDTLPSKFYANLSGEQLSAINPIVLNNMPAENLRVINNKTLADLQPSFWASLGGATINSMMNAMVLTSNGYVPDVNTMKEKVGALSPDDLKGISGANLAAIDSSVYGFFTKQQTEALTAKQMQDFSLAASGTPFSALSADAIKGFSTDALKSMSAEVFSDMLLGADATNVGPRVLSLTPESISGVYVQHIKALPPIVLQNFSLQQKAALSPADVIALSAEQLAALDPSAKVVGAPNQGAGNDILESAEGMVWYQGGAGTDTLKIKVSSTSVKLQKDSYDASLWHLIDESQGGAQRLVEFKKADTGTFIIKDLSNSALLGTAFVKYDIETIKIVGSSNQSLLSFMLEH